MTPSLDLTNNKQTLLDEHHAEVFKEKKNVNIRRSMAKGNVIYRAESALICGTDTDIEALKDRVSIYYSDKDVVFIYPMSMIEAMKLAGILKRSIRSAEEYIQLIKSTTTNIKDRAIILQMKPQPQKNKLEEIVRDYNLPDQFSWSVGKGK